MRNFIFVILLFVLAIAGCKKDEAPVYSGVSIDKVILKYYPMYDDYDGDDTPADLYIVLTAGDNEYNSREKTVMNAMAMPVIWDTKLSVLPYFAASTSVVLWLYDADEYGDDDFIDMVHFFPGDFTGQKIVVKTTEKVSVEFYLTWY